MKPIEVVARAFLFLPLGQLVLAWQVSASVMLPPRHLLLHTFATVLAVVPTYVGWSTYVNLRQPVTRFPATIMACPGILCVFM